MKKKNKHQPSTGEKEKNRSSCEKAIFFTTWGRFFFPSCQFHIQSLLKKEKKNLFSYFLLLYLGSCRIFFAKTLLGVWHINQIITINSVEEILNEERERERERWIGVVNCDMTPIKKEKLGGVRTEDSWG